MIVSSSTKRRKRFLRKDKLKALQLERLQAIVGRAYSHNQFYRNLYDEAGVKPSDIKSLEDIQKLPFLEKKQCGQPIHMGWHYGLDTFDLKVEMKDASVLNNAERTNTLSHQMAESVKAVTGNTPKVELVPADSLPRASGAESKTASARVEDRRKK